MPTSAIISTARARACVMRWRRGSLTTSSSCARMTSHSWVSTVMLGLSAVSASCIVIAMRLPRKARIAGGASVVSSTPSNSTLPEVILPGGLIRPMTLAKVTLLPDPDSPTMPRHSPRITSRSTSCTALTTPSWVLKLVDRPRSLRMTSPPPARDATAACEGTVAAGESAPIIPATSDRRRRAAPGWPR